jgi:trehalose-6-phosphatase
LHGLLIDTRNTVVIIGSHTKQDLEQWFGRSANNGNNFWLAAESGYLYRAANKEGWHKLTDELQNFGWIEKVKKIM